MSSAPSPDHASLSILLLQARKGQDMELQEQDCFLERCHLERSQLHSLNLARTDSLPDVTELLMGTMRFSLEEPANTQPLKSTIGYPLHSTPMPRSSFKTSGNPTPLSSIVRTALPGEVSNVTVISSAFPCLTALLTAS